MHPTLAETTAWLVDIDSETGAEAAICDAVADRLAALAQVRVGESLVVGEPTGRPLIVLVGHLDTVPRQGQGPARFEGDRLWGLGSSDMKGGLAVMIHLLEDPAVTAGSYDVVGLFYAAEEGPAANNQLERVLESVTWLAGADCAVVLEPSDGEMQHGCNGVINARVTFTGQAAHSARPWWGENAVTKAGEWLAGMHRFEPEDHVIDGLVFRRTVAVTRATGGVANNVVPAEFTLNLNMRFTPDTAVEAAVAELQALCAAADSFEVVDMAPAGAVSADHPFLQRLSEISGAPRAAKQGWTDVARFSARGIPAVNFGPGSAQQAHQAAEWVSVAGIEATHSALLETLSR